MPCRRPLPQGALLGSRSWEIKLKPLCQVKPHLLHLSGLSPSARGGNGSRYSFDVPWSKMPSSTRKLMDTEKCPAAAGRMKGNRIVVSKILTGKKPGKAHHIIAGKKDSYLLLKIEGHVVSTGYESLVKQVMSRIDSYGRQTSFCPEKAFW